MIRIIIDILSYGSREEWRDKVQTIKPKKNKKINKE